MARKDTLSYTTQPKMTTILDDQPPSRPQTVKDNWRPDSWEAHNPQA